MWGVDSLRVRAFVVTVLFTILMVVIGNLAWVTASETTRPWFSSTVLTSTFSISLLASVVVAIGLSAVAMHRASQLDDTIRSLGLRIASLRGGVHAAQAPVVGDHESAPASADEEVASILDELEGYSSEPLVEVEGSEPGGLAGLPATAQAEGRSARASLLKELWAHKSAARTARSQVWTSVAGPLVASILFIAIAGAMLPGAEGFAETNFKLATTLTLILGYGWPFLMAWAVVSIAMMPSGRDRSSA